MFFGRGLKAEMEIKNEAKYLKTKQVWIEW